jgi:uncharacterized RDD family membrane protein YckC
MVFQYLFLVHGERTPGMKLASLDLATFSGGRTSVFSRQCRALACALSAFSVGLGYAWTLVDEDQLGWHDRITGTCVQQKQPAVRFSLPVQVFLSDLDRRWKGEQLLGIEGL